MEYYDIKKDPIKLYFSEKIQMTIMKKRTIDLVQEKEPKVSKGKSLNTSKEGESRVATNQSNLDSNESQKESIESQSNSDDDSEELGDLDPLMTRPLQPKNIKEVVNKLRQNRKASLTTVREGRSKKYAFEMKRSKHKKTEAVDMGKVMREYSNNSEANDQLVKGSLDSQRESIQRRIQEKSKEGAWADFWEFFGGRGTNAKRKTGD